MRDCIFLLADKNMEAAFTGFFTREQFHSSLGIRPFEFDLQKDIIVEAGSDPGVYNRAHELIRPYQKTHRYAVVVLDNAWDGSPGVEKIRNNIMKNLIETGWDEENCAVIVIDPELEIWILQDNRNVEEAFRFKQDISLRKWLEQKGLWDASALKPADPKKAVNGPRFARNYVEDPEYGIPFLGSVDILAADLSNLTLLSKKQVASHPELLIDEGWTLITCSGTIGRMVYSRSEMMGMAGSQHFMRVIANPDKILPGYLYAYLSSSFGVPIVISGTYGSIIQSIEPQHIADLPVPRLGKDIEEKAHKNIEESAKLRSEYQIQIKEATHRLFSAVGLKDITAVDWHKMGKDLGFSHNLESHISLRAANFNPRFKKLCETISSTQYKEIDEICMPGTLQRAGRYKRIDADPEFGCQLIGQRQLFWLRPEGRWVAKSALGDDVFVKPGTILVAARGTLGESELYCRSEFIWGAAISMAYSEDMLRIIADEQIMPRGCLFAFLRSETAFRMLRSSTMGSKMQDHHHEFVSHLPVPYPDKEIQQEIHEIVVNAYEKRHLSNVLEDEAVAIVEQAISSGGV